MQQRLLSDGVPIASITALTNDEFKAAGELMVSSIAQGGPPPSILAKGVYEYVIGGTASKCYTRQLGKSTQARTENTN